MMKFSVAIFAVFMTHVPALAGSPFYEQTESQKRRVVVPYIRALTGCVADTSLRDPDGAIQYRAGLFTNYAAHQLRNCPMQMNALLEMYDATYGEGEAERFIKGPYLADLKRAVLSLIKPQLDVKVEASQRKEEAEREAMRQREEDARIEAKINDANTKEREAQAEIDKQRSVVFNHNNIGVETPDILNPPPPPGFLNSRSKQDLTLSKIDEYAATHQTTAAEIVKQTGMSLVDIEDYISSGERGGQTAEQVIAGLMAIHVVSIDQNTSRTSKLSFSDMDKIVDTYKKDEMRFVRDFKGRHFDDQVPFANARQNIIIAGSYTVIFGQNNFSGNVTCETSDPKQVSVIADWDKGDKVHISGEIRDVTFGNIQLDNCLMQRS